MPANAQSADIARARARALPEQQLMTTVSEALAAYDRLADHIGTCLDGGCCVKRPTGMHTNGGCKCWQDKYKAQRMMYAGQKLADAVRAAELDRKGEEG